MPVSHPQIHQGQPAASHVDDRNGLDRSRIERGSDGSPAGAIRTERLGFAGSGIRPIVNLEGHPLSFPQRFPRCLAPAPWTFLVALVLVGRGPVSAEAAPPPQVVLGAKSSLVLLQPRVDVRLFADAEAQQLLGPQARDTFLLDTGSNFNLAFAGATGELVQGGYQTEGTYLERGVAGTQLLDVSAPYRLDFIGSDGSTGNIADTRILSSDSVEIDTTGLLNLNGIVGMPAMVGRVTSLDNTRIVGESFLNQGPFTQFSDQPPPDSGHRYSIPVRPIDFPPEGDPPLPTGAPLPFVDARLVEDCFARTSQTLIDTGAQLSIISPRVAFELGLDRNGNGTFDDEATGFLPVGGIGGQVVAPTILVDEIRLPTVEGPELIWTDLQMIVLEVDPKIDAVIGMDLLASSEADIFGLGDPYAEQIHFDFRELLEGNGRLLLDLAAAKDLPVELATQSPGDANGDGEVDSADLEVLVEHFRREVVDAGRCGDFTGNGLVDITDLVVLAQHWTGEPVAVPLAGHGVVTVPEPVSAASVVWIVCLACLLRRKRGRRPILT